MRFTDLDQLGVELWSPVMGACNFPWHWDRHFSNIWWQDDDRRHTATHLSFQEKKGTVWPWALLGRLNRAYNSVCQQNVALACDRRLRERCDGWCVCQWWIAGGLPEDETILHELHSQKIGSKQLWTLRVALLTLDLYECLESVLDTRASYSTRTNRTKPVFTSI